MLEYSNNRAENSGFQLLEHNLVKKGRQNRVELIIIKFCYGDNYCNFTCIFALARGIPYDINLFADRCIPDNMLYTIGKSNIQS